MTGYLVAAVAVAVLVQEFAAASQQQAVGVEQVSRAMAVVDQTTQRNAAAAEELSSTAEEMAAQAESLQQLVGFFQVRDVPRPAASAKPQPQLEPKQPPAPSRRMLADGAGWTAWRSGSGSDPQSPPLPPARAARS